MLDVDDLPEIPAKKVKRERSASPDESFPVQKSVFPIFEGRPFFKFPANTFCIGVRIMRTRMTRMLFKNAAIKPSKKIALKLVIQFFHLTDFQRILFLLQELSFAPENMFCLGLMNP